MKNKKNILGTVGLLLLGTVFGMIFVSSFDLGKIANAQVKLGSDAPPVELISPELQVFQDAFYNVADKVTPSIVEIKVVSKTSENPHNGLEFFFPFEQMPREQQGLGSGVVITKDGYIVTNNHVIEKATKVEVTLHNKKVYEAEVIGTDPLTDLGVIKIDAEDLQPIYFGDSEKIRVGQWVMAIGNPLSFSSTVTAGIISAKNRSLKLIQDSYGVENFIQTDAVINPGNSGGALVDLNGALVGINTAIATNGFSSSYIGYGFAIPVNIVKAVAQDLIDNGSVSRGYIGVRIEAVSDATAKAVGLDEPRGVLVQGLVEDGAAAKEDIQEGDIILEIDGHKVYQPNELQGYVAQKRAGEKINLLIFRDGKKFNKAVKLLALEKDEKSKKIVRRKSSEDNTENIIFKDLGLSVKDLSSKDKSELEVENGIYIVNVDRFSKAEEAGLGRGLVIQKVDREKVESVKKFEKLIENKKGGAVLLQVRYPDKSKRFVGLEIPN